MTLDKIKDTINEIKKRYGITHCGVNEEEAEGEVKFILFTIRFKVTKEKKVLDFSR